MARWTEQFKEIDSGGAQLGQSCANEDCIDGTCFRAKNEKDGKCMHVLLDGDKGCRKKYHVCTNGLDCYNNVCLKQPPKKETTDEKESKVDDNSNIYLYILYGFVAIMLIILIVMIILLATQSQNTSTTF